MTLVILFLVGGEYIELPGWGSREAPTEEICEQWKENTYEYIESLGYDDEAVLIFCNISYRDVTV